MISDVVNWFIINVLSNPRVFTSLLALIILIVAGFLMSEKRIKIYSFKRILGATLFVLAIFVFLFANITDLADVFTVWATLILAGVAIFSFEESRHLRGENRQREEREREERFLERIIDWAEGITVFVSKQIVSNRATPTVILKDAATRLEELNVLAAKGIYIESLVSGIFPNNAVLLADIKNLRELIKQHTGVVSIVVTAEDNKQVELMEILEEWLRDEDKSAVKVRDDAIKLIKFVASIHTNFK